MAETGKFSGREVVIVEAARLPVGRGHEEKGYYKDVHASSLLAKTYDEVIERAGIDASEVEDVVAGCVQQFGEQGINIGRNAWLEAGLPIETPATTVDRQCGSAQQAVNFARRADRLRRPRRRHRRRRRAHGPHLLRGQHRGDEGARLRLLARADGALQPRPAGHLGRDDRRQVGDPPLRARRDRPPVPPARRTRRPRRAASSARSIPLQINGDTYVTDQGIRPPTRGSLEKLASLKPAFKEDGKITAGNSSQVSDGAAAVLLMTREKADELGLKPRAKDRRPDHGRRRPGDDAHRARSRRRRRSWSATG